MSKKMMLLATALTALAFAALPAVASAGEPQTHCGPSGSGCVISIHSSNPAELSKTGTSLKIICSTTTGAGEVGTTTGSIELTFHECTDNLFHLPCTTSGQSSKTITTEPLTYHNIYPTKDKTKPGVLITPNATSGSFAHFSCADGTHRVTGSGVIGTMTSPEPACNSNGASITLKFEQSVNGHQKHKQITGTGAIYDLHEGSTTAAQVGTGTITPTSGSISVTCP